MSQHDDRDYSGMYEIEPDVWVKRVHIYENDPMWLAMRQEQSEIKALLQAVLNRLVGGINVKQVTSIL